MKQLTDEVFAQVREALAMNRVMGRDADGNYTRECTPKKITAAIAALDTAQPVQVNAMLVEALEKLQRHDFEMRSKTGDGFATYVVRIIDDALTAAKQAQPERAPLIPCRCFDEVSKRLCADKTRCSRVEAHGIKQGGQQ